MSHPRIIFILIAAHVYLNLVELLERFKVVQRSRVNSFREKYDIAKGIPSSGFTMPRRRAHNIRGPP